MHQAYIQFPQLPEAFPLGTDSVLLADFVTLRPGAHVYDLGAGVGTLGLLLCAKEPSCQVDGIELQAHSAALAQQVIAANGCAQRVRVQCGDLRQIAQFAAPGRYQTVVANPPYFPVGSGAAPQTESLRIARTECCCSFAQLCSVASYLLPSAGSFFLVHRPERLAQLLSALQQAQLEPKRLRLVRARPDAAPSLVLLQCKKNAKPGLVFEPDLLLAQQDGTPSAQYRRIYGL